MHNFGFIFRTIIFTVIMITAIIKEGSGDGIRRVFYVSTENMNINEVSKLFDGSCCLMFSISS